ncbi:hypothetical protein GCM10009631_20550 [Corynebacterium glaucum]
MSGFGDFRYLTSFFGESIRFQGVYRAGVGEILGVATGMWYGLVVL